MGGGVSIQVLDPLYQGVFKLNVNLRSYALVCLHSQNTVEFLVINWFKSFVGNTIF